LKARRAGMETGAARFMSNWSIAYCGHELAAR
jgi:hypothetical protein